MSDVGDAVWIGVFVAFVFMFLLYAGIPKITRPHALTVLGKEINYSYHTEIESLPRSLENPKENLYVLRDSEGKRIGVYSVPCKNYDWRKWSCEIVKIEH